EWQGEKVTLCGRTFGLSEIELQRVSVISAGLVQRNDAEPPQCSRFAFHKLWRQKKARASTEGRLCHTLATDAAAVCPAKCIAPSCVGCAPPTPASKLTIFATNSRGRGLPPQR